MVDINQVLRIHDTTVREWHCSPITHSFSGLLGLVCQQHEYNFRLWHQEDKARCPEASDHEIACVKRAIDKLNQQRNDWIEKIDEWFVEDLVAHRLVPVKSAVRNTETPGSVIDRLSILALRLYHLNEQLQRDDADDELLVSLRRKLQIGRLQKSDLAQSLTELVKDIYSGRKSHQTYRQMKMYNDPQLNPFLVAANSRRLVS